MSMPTAIEIVREMQLWRRSEGKFADARESGAFKALELMPYTPQQFGEALDAVLRDAERFAALVLAADPHHEGEAIFVRVYDDETRNWKAVAGTPGTLAELADRLMNGGAK